MSRNLLRVIVAIAFLVVVGIVMTVLSPWPGAVTMRWSINQDAAQVREQVAEDAPTDVRVIRDRSYAADDPDAKLDVYLSDDLGSGVRQPVVVWIHGGAWLAGDKQNLAGYFKRIAKAGYTVVVPNYSLASNHVYPTQVHQLNKALTAVVENHAAWRADASAIVLAGEEAGAHLAATLATTITNTDYAADTGVVPALHPSQLQGAVLIDGIYDLKTLAEGERELDLPGIFRWGDRIAVWAFSGTRNLDHPVIKRSSPMHHVTADFPPTFLTGGPGDPLTSTQSQPFATKLANLGVPVTELFYPDDQSPKLGHGYAFHLNDAGQKALDEVVKFLTSLS